MSKLMNSSYFINRTIKSINAVNKVSDVKYFLIELLDYINSVDSYIEYHHPYSESFLALRKLKESNLDIEELKSEINIKLIEVLCNLGEIQLDRIDKLEKKIIDLENELDEEVDLDDL